MAVVIVQLLEPNRIIRTEWLSREEDANSVSLRATERLTGRIGRQSGLIVMADSSVLDKHACSHRLRCDRSELPESSNSGILRLAICSTIPVHSSIPPATLLIRTSCCNPYCPPRRHPSHHLPVGRRKKAAISLYVGSSGWGLSNLGFRSCGTSHHLISLHHNTPTRFVST